jgi:plasmid stabilization system protein ParE
MNKNNYVVEWTSKAYLDLDEIVTYISNESLENALSAFQKIKLKAETLCNFPEKGRVVPELKYHNILKYRELIVSVWRIIYKIEMNKVFVMAVIDGRRNVEDILLERILREN